MRLFLILLALSVIITSIGSAETISLFNGKDLTGWDGDPTLWTVSDGAITGTTKGNDHLPYNKFLIWRGGAVKNFTLKARFRLEGNNNSGIQYRSQHLPAAGENVVAGYQADIHAAPDYTGMLYDERGRGVLCQRGQKVIIAADGERYVDAPRSKPKPLDLTAWHELKIAARGNHLLHEIDGLVVVDVFDHDTKNRELEGIIALQVHRGPAMKIQFKDIVLETLPDGGVQAPADTPIPPTANKVPSKPPAKKNAPKNNPAPKSKPKKDPTVLVPEITSPQWIWITREAKPNQVVKFRKEFIPPDAVHRAYLIATGDDEAIYYIDGKKVATTSAWDSPTYVDVTEFFTTSPRRKSPPPQKATGLPNNSENRKAKNREAPKKKTPSTPTQHLLAITVKNATGPGALLAKLVFETTSGKNFAIVTDDTWLCDDTNIDNWQSLTYDDRAWTTPVVIGKVGDSPWRMITEAMLKSLTVQREPKATPISHMKVAKDFHVELLYSVPQATQGSWVNMCVDPKGRLIVCDQYGALFRVTPPPIGSSTPIKLEKINVPLGEAQGLLWAFDCLYVVVNRGQKFASGLYRVLDTNNDDQLDKVELLRELQGGGEHGPHAVILTPDRRNLVVVCGNNTQLTKLDYSRVPRVWGEDHLLERMPDGRGFMRGVLGPGGAIYKTDPMGKNWELLAVGFRNQFDAAFRNDGELFTYDADMEWDLNTPWYRPTRICHVVSGAEFGWRNGAGKWPTYYPDSLPAVVDIGPGSPTGVSFGYGAKFPSKYQEALFACDWSYGKLYAVHLNPAGASFTGQLEEFVTGTPLPLTDVVINPMDGALYFTIGGRRVQSGLYRVTYQGKEATTPVAKKIPHSPLAQRRRELESYHIGKNPHVITELWPDLGHTDRHIRYAARVALEHQDPDKWQTRALSERNPRAAIQALLALTRVRSTDPYHRAPNTKATPKPKDTKTPPTTSNHQPKHETSENAPTAAQGILKQQILDALTAIDWTKLNINDQLDLLRVYGVVFNRMGAPCEKDQQDLIARFDARFPSTHRILNAELCQLLVYLQAPNTASKTVALLQTAPTQEEQIEYAKSLRLLKQGWTPALRQTYFNWFIKARQYRGGASFGLFVERIKRDAIANLPPEDLLALKPIVDAVPQTQGTTIATKRPFVKDWQLDELLLLTETKLKHRDFQRGRAMFGAANCFACHRFDNEGGALGPDLQGLAGRFNARDLLESIVDPNKVISDQYAAVNILTYDGQVITGRIVNLGNNAMTINTNMLDPNALVSIKQHQVETMEPSKVSMMPKGLLNTLKEEEILDLLAYLLSRGDAKHSLFARPSQ